MMQFPKKCKFLHNLIMLHGGNIRIVGGYVRDLLLCKTNIDIDLVTDLPPEIIIEICKEHKLSFMTLGIDYGTITVIINNEKFEITSLRKDIKCYGRVAEVSFTKNWEEDAMRRDFTINALYLDIDNNIYDYYSGISDLNNNKVRFIGDPITRIKEDYLRIMRYFRFLNIFDTVNIHDASLEAAITLSCNLNLISKERLKDELFKILSSSNPQISLQYIINYKILHNTELNFISNITSINGLKFSKDPMVNLAILMHLARQTKCDLKFSNAEKKRLMNLLQPILTQHNLYLLYEIGEQQYLDRIALSECFNYNFDPIPVYTFPINGYDLLKLNYQPHDFKYILKQIKNLWISSNFPDKAELLKIINNSKI